MTERKHSIGARIFSWLWTFALVVVALYVILNFPALLIRGHFFAQRVLGEKAPRLAHALKLDSVGEGMDVDTIPTDDRIKIPRINVDAPLLFPTDGTKLKDLYPDLEKGVVRYPGTGMPGQGNFFVTGHSSQYWFFPGAYNTVFTLLPELKAGDKIYVFYNGTRFVYTLTTSKTVMPSDASVLGATSEPIISLMTCVPVGTNISRLVWTGTLDR